MKRKLTLHLAHADIVAATDGLIIPVVMVFLTTTKASFVALEGKKSFLTENGLFVKSTGEVIIVCKGNFGI